jgi:putative N6-adenine-specific DNA methylase
VTLSCSFIAIKDTNSMSCKVFATCTPGLEEVLEREVVSLGYSPQRGKGGVEVIVPALRDVMVMNLHLRTASRVLLHLFDVQLPNKKRLYHEISQRDWRPYFTGLPSMAIDVPFSSHPDFTNTLYVAQLAKDAICDQLRRATGERPSVDTKTPQVQFSLVVDEEKASVSFDTSLEPLGKRGYRSESVDAPLKETLAAALLMFADYTPEAILLDPCCGGGTFLIEAGLIATNTAPGLLRKTFGFLRHPDFQDEEWMEVRQKAFCMVKEYPKGKIFGFEKEAKSYRLLLQSIARAGLMGEIEVFHTDFRDGKLPVVPDFIITNPPFGVRLGDAKRWEPLYRALGTLMKRGTQKPAVGAVLTIASGIAKEIGLKPKKKIPVSHGGLDCVFCIYDLF